jgi:hypothetical protein
MSAPDLAFIADWISVGIGVFLIWYVRQFLTAQVEGLAKRMGEIDAQVAKLDDLEVIERRLKQVAADVELSKNRKLQVENLTRTKDLEFRERQLNEFLWPLYMRLQMDNAVWERMAQITPHSETRDRELAAKIEKEFLLPNHDKALEIIESKRHFAGVDGRLEEQLLKYVRHLAVYRALRALEIRDRDPVDVGEPWPPQLFAVVREVTLERQREYDRLLQAHLHAAEGGE